MTLGQGFWLLGEGLRFTPELQGHEAAPDFSQNMYHTYGHVNTSVQLHFVFNLESFQ